MASFCAVCFKASSLRCSKCHTTHYCSSTCQKIHWPLHKATTCSQLPSKNGLSLNQHQPNKPRDLSKKACPCFVGQKLLVLERSNSDYCCNLHCDNTLFNANNLAIHIYEDMCGNLVEPKIHKIPVMFCTESCKTTFEKEIGPTTPFLVDQQNLIPISSRSNQ